MIKRLLLALVLVLSSFPAAAQGKDLPDFADLAERQGPAVVNISSTQTIRGNRMFQQFPDIDEDDPMFEFFRRFMPRPAPGIPPREHRNKSLGSGFIVSSDGFILTNAHVVDGADEVVVKLNDKREFKARVVGTDKRTDVALLKIEATGLPKVALGDPARLRVGEWVVAIGSPFGFDNTVTAGIVSAKGRSLPQENFVPFIQTDVAINPGNSGGPLFNLKGEVVGINSQIYSRTGGFMGLSFAIPIDVAMDVQNQLRASGRVSRGRIGVVIQEVTKDIADSFGLGKPAGALVNAVEKGGPAERAGIEGGDVILKFDGKQVGASSDLPRIVGATRPGSKVPLQVWRKGTAKDLIVTVGEIPEEKSMQKAKANPKPSEAPANRLGLVLSELSAEQKKELKLSHGLLVDDVRGSAARGDLRPGDVILSLVHKGVSHEIKGGDQFNALLAGIDRNATLTLLVRRGEQQTYITLRSVSEK